MPVIYHDFQFLFNRPNYQRSLRPLTQVARRSKGEPLRMVVEGVLHAGCTSCSCRLANVNAVMQSPKWYEKPAIYIGKLFTKKISLFV